MDTLEMQRPYIRFLFVSLTLVFMSVLIGCSKTTQPNQSIPTLVSVPTATHTLRATVKPTATPIPTPKPAITSAPTITPAPTTTPAPTITVASTIAVAPIATFIPPASVGSLPAISSVPTKVVDTGAKSRDGFGDGGLAKNLESWADIKLPQFIAASHINISDIAHVSKFRSSAGHDFSDSFEVCCSMKHYFIPIDYYGTRFTEPIYSPVNGVVLYLSEPSGGHSDDWKIGYEEQTGKKPPVDYRDWNIYIRPDSAPNVWITHMHVNPLDEIIKKVPPTDGQSMMMGRSKAATEGYRVKAGDLIAHGLGEIIVKRYLEGSGMPSGCNSADSRKKSLQRPIPGCKDKVQLHSIFEFMTDEVFDEYREIRDVTRADFIINAEERAKNPLVCDGEFFANSGNSDDPETYVELQEAVSTSDTLYSESSDTLYSESTSPKIGEQGSLPGFQTLASGRGIIASFEDSGTQVLSNFTADQSYFLIIATTGGPIQVSLEDNSGKRSIFSRPLGNGISTYETDKMYP
ncbi:uncharacterized protein METZ01_LOCUS142723, partial [marine metagenome]